MVKRIYKLNGKGVHLERSRTTCYTHNIHHALFLKGNNIILIIVVSKGNLGATSTTGTFSVLKIGNSRGIGLMVYMASHYQH